MKYETVTPYATYAPWNLDAEFQKCYAAIKDYTLVDIYRCYELWKLVEQSAKVTKGGLLDGCILEVGVWKGGTGALIAKRAELCGLKDPVFLCDNFKGVVKAGSEDSVYLGGEHSDTSFKEVVKFIFGKMDLFDIRILKGVFPDDTGEEIEHCTFRFCHIDVDTYQSAKDITEWVWDRLVPGGIIVYDDYGFEDCNGVTKHVEDTATAKDRIFIHNLNGHAIVVKL